jgi:hypothetical protein
VSGASSGSAYHHLLTTAKEIIVKGRTILKIKLFISKIIDHGFVFYLRRRF